MYTVTVYIGGMKRKIRFQMYLSEPQKRHIERCAARLGIAMVDYLRRLIDADKANK